MKSTFAGMRLGFALTATSLSAAAKPSSFPRHVVHAVVMQNATDGSGSDSERQPEAGIAPGSAANHEHTEGTVFVAWSSPTGPRVAEIDVKSGAHLREVRFAWAKDTWLRIARRGAQVYVVGGRVGDDAGDGDAVHLARLGVADLAVQSDAVIGHGVRPEVVADGNPAHAVVTAWNEPEGQERGVHLSVVDGVTRRVVSANDTIRIAAAGDHVDVLCGRDIVRLGTATLASLGSFALPTREGYPVESKIGAHGDDFVFSSGERTMVLSPGKPDAQFFDAQEDFAMAEDPASGNIVTSHGQLYNRSWQLLASTATIDAVKGLVVVSGRAIGLSYDDHGLKLTVVSTKR